MRDLVSRRKGKEIKELHIARLDNRNYLTKQPAGWARDVSFLKLDRHAKVTAAR